MEKTNIELITIAQFCRDIGIGRRTFYDLAAKGEAPPVVQLTRRRRGIRKDAATAWVAKREVA